MTFFQCKLIIKLYSIAEVGKGTQVIKRHNIFNKSDPERPQEVAESSDEGETEDTPDDEQETRRYSRF